MEITINPKYNLGQKIWVVDRISKYTNCPTCKGSGEVSILFNNENKLFDCPDCFGGGNLDLFLVPANLEIKRISFDDKLRFRYECIGYMRGSCINEDEIFLLKEEALSKAKKLNEEDWSLNLPKNLNIENYIRY